MLQLRTRQCTETQCWVSGPNCEASRWSRRVSKPRSSLLELLARRDEGRGERRGGGEVQSFLVGCLEGDGTPKVNLNKAECECRQRFPGSAISLSLETVVAWGRSVTLCRFKWVYPGPRNRGIQYLKLFIPHAEYQSTFWSRAMSLSQYPVPLGNPTGSRASSFRASTIPTV